jgi:hypothetical protein
MPISCSSLESRSGLGCIPLLRVSNH